MEEPLVKSEVSQIFIGGLSFSVTEEILQDTFRDYGTITECLIKVKKQKQGKLRAGQAHAIITTSSEGCRKILIKKFFQIQENKVRCVAHYQGEGLQQYLRTLNQRKVIISGLPTESTDLPELELYFSKFGIIENCFIVEKFRKHHKLEKACMIFSTPEEAQKLIAEGGIHTFNGIELRCHIKGGRRDGKRRKKLKEELDTEINRKKLGLPPMPKKAKKTQSQSGNNPNDQQAGCKDSNKKDKLNQVLTSSKNEKIKKQGNKQIKSSTNLPSQTRLIEANNLLGYLQSPGESKKITSGRRKKLRKKKVLSGVLRSKPRYGGDSRYPSKQHPNLMQLKPHGSYAEPWSENHFPMNTEEFDFLECLAFFRNLNGANGFLFPQEQKIQQNTGNQYQPKGNPSQVKNYSKESKNKAPRIFEHQNDLQLGRLTTQLLAPRILKDRSFKEYKPQGPFKLSINTNPRDKLKMDIAIESNHNFSNIRLTRTQGRNNSVLGK